MGLGGGGKARDEGFWFRGYIYGSMVRLIIDRRPMYPVEKARKRHHLIHRPKAHSRSVEGEDSQAEDPSNYHRRPIFPRAEGPFPPPPKACSYLRHRPIQTAIHGPKVCLVMGRRPV